MATVRIDRFKIGSADADEMLARRAALLTAVRDTFPGLIEARLAKLDDQTWMDVWKWDSMTNAQAAREGALGIPEAGAAFSLLKDHTVEYAEVVDEG